MITCTAQGVRSRIDNIANELDMVLFSGFVWCARHLFRIRNSAPGPGHARSIASNNDWAYSPQ